MVRRTSNRVNNRRTNNNNNDEPDVAEVVAQQIAGLIPNIVVQVVTAMNQVNANNNNGNNGTGGNNHGNGNGCTYKEFLACKPKEFDGKGGALAVTRWFEKMDYVMDISNCSDDNKVKFATSSLVDKALTWWNTQVQARGREAAVGMSWADFKALMLEEFCPRNEMQKLEHKFWDHTMVGANHSEYTDRFHELARLVPHLVTHESKRIDRYIYGLAPQIRGMVAATEPPTIQSAIFKADALTDEMVRTGALSKVQEKRSNFGESSERSNSKKAKFEDNRGNGKKVYVGFAPKCEKCNYHHYPNLACRVCNHCKKGGHLAKDCKLKEVAAVPINVHRPGVCYECGGADHYRNACPKLAITSGTNGNRANVPQITDGKQGNENQANKARGRAYFIGAKDIVQEANNATGDDKA